MPLYYGFKGDGLLYRLRLREVGTFADLAEELIPSSALQERLILFPPDKGLVMGSHEFLWLQVIPRLPMWARYGPKRIPRFGSRGFLSFVSPTQTGVDAVLDWAPPPGFALILGIYANDKGLLLTPPYLGLWGNGVVGHPRLPNIYETGKVCMGNDQQVLTKIQLNPFTFLKPVIDLLCSSKWNMDLYRTDWHIFSLWDENQQQVYDFWKRYYPLNLHRERGLMSFSHWSTTFCESLFGEGGQNGVESSAS